MANRNSLTRMPIVGGNWKMNTTLSTAREITETLVRSLGDTTDVEIVLCPPFPNLETVFRISKASTLQLGGQNLHWEDSGAYTGEVSAPMLVATGCTWVIVGHSERRQGTGVSSEMVNRKTHAALHHGLSLILAIGETRDERHGGRMEQVLDKQLRESLSGIETGAMENIVIAYEPVWAIGTGETASPDQAQSAHAFIRGIIADLYGEPVAHATRIQYGGSVTSANCREIMAKSDVDGALVGGASLKPDEFSAIVRGARPPG